jgi:aspartate ammonia-lyase
MKVKVKMAHNGDFRIEEDFLGKMQVPAEAYYGIQTLRAVENFPITGYRIHESLIISMAIVKKAAALANMEVGFLDHEIGEHIVQAATEIIEGKYHDQFLVDPIQGGAGTSINMNANEVIANIALEKMGHKKGNYEIISPNTHVNMSQSTNDAVPTAAHICVRMLLNKLLKTMKELNKTFVEKATAFDHVIKVGRTHLQDAVPIRFGQEMDTYARVLARDIVRIGACGQYLNEVNMGATAVGTGLNAHQIYIDRTSQYLQELSGFPIWQAESLVDATQNTDCYTEVSAALKVCAINMSKIANDLRLMASGPRCGFFEINLPPRQPGSSIMPGKVNPVMAELINQVSFQVVGNDHTICMASEAGQFELNVMAPVLIFNLIQSICMMDNAFRVFNDFCVKDITVNEERMRKHVDESIGLITALNPYIGYEKASLIAREALENGEMVKDLCLKYDVLTEEQLEKILEPFAMTKPR